MIDLKNLTISKALTHLKKKDFSAVELTQFYLDEISKRDNKVHAYLEVFEDAKKQAELADKMLSNGEVGKLCGIPLAIKDNILIKGKKASASSKMLENYTATYDATAITKLKDAGSILLGRTNMDEFAMGSSTENSAFGATRNPHDTTRVPGGSSGGSAAAVAMDGALAALGTDTGGSVRQPASFCGLVGLKPTYGSISRYGIMAMGSSLDQIGPVTKSVTDAELLFAVMSGKDPLDSTTISEQSYSKKFVNGKPKIGVPRHLLEQKGISADVLANFNDSIERLKSLGYEIKDVSLPNVGYSLAVYYIIMPAEVSSNLARFDGVKYGLHVEGKNLLEDYMLSRREGFGKEARRRILLGTYVLSSGYYDAYYNKAQNLRNIIMSDFKKAWESVDVIMTPTTPTPAFKIGEKSADPLQMYLADIFTVTANIIGIPAISIPSGFASVDDKKLPLGIQFMASHACEKILFDTGKEFSGEV